MYNFNYVRASSLSEAAQALAGGDATLIAGGHTLIPTLKQRLASPKTVVDISQLSELKGIRRDGGNLVIGAATTHAEVAASQEVRSAIPALAKLASGIGDAQVSNRGTIGGSVANNDPAADYPAALLGLGATIVTDKSQLDADSYFTGLFSTALQPGEIITSIRFPIPDKAGYAKMEQRASRYCLVGVFVAVKSGGMFASGNVRVGVTGAGQNGVFRVAEMEQALQNNFAPFAVASVKVPASGLMSDMHGSADYRAALITAMAERAVEAAAA